MLLFLMKNISIRIKFLIFHYLKSKDTFLYVGAVMQDYFVQKFTALLGKY